MERQAGGPAKKRYTGMLPLGVDSARLPAPVPASSFDPAFSPMKIRLCTVLLIVATFVPSFASAQTTLPTKKVVFPSTGPARLSEGEIAELRQLAPSLNIVFPARDKMDAEIVDADAVIGTITPEQVRSAKKLKWVQVVSAGVENYLFPEIKNSPITLTNMKIIQGIEIADHAFALLLGLTRRIDLAMEWKRTQTWDGREFRPLFELNGKTAVIVGVGGIGTQIAVRAKAFGMTVIGVDPKDIPFTPYLDRTVWPDRLEEVLPEADVVFVSVPHT